MRKIKIYFILATILFSIPLSSMSAYALDEEFFSGNNILIYNPDGSCVGDSSSTTAQSENKDYLGGDVYSADALAKIKEYQPLYEKAVASEGYPWQILAVLHYQETGLSRTNPANGQGLFQDYSKKYPDLYTPGMKVDDATFLKQAARAIEEYNGKIKSSGIKGMKEVTKDDIKNKDPDSLKEIFLLYNGPGGGHYADKASALGYGEKIYEGSPYVMNQADAARDPRHPDKMNKAWPGTFVADGVYDPSATMSRPGTYVQFAALAGLASSSCGTDGGGIVAGNILETAKNFAWDQPAEEHAKGSNFKSLAKQSFVDAVAKYTTLSQAAAPSANSSYADCGKFVGTVMRASGADPNYPQAGTSNQYTYVKEHTNKYQIITSPKQSDLQPGDILISAGNHTAIYAGDIGTSKKKWGAYPAGSKLVLIEAAQDSRVPSWVPALSYTLNLSGVIAARMK